MEYRTHLYLILHPNLALVGSQYDPSRFSLHYTSGSSRYYSGKVIFAEIDNRYRHPYFRIDEMLEELRPHEDDRPKATKFISSYRVLEHIKLEAIETLHLVTPEGDCLELQPETFDKNDPQHRQIRIYAEIAPLRMLVLSDYGAAEYGQYITDPENAKGAPKLFYTQIDLDINEFLEQLKDNPFKETPIRSIHPTSLRDAYKELIRYPDKHTKGLCLDSSLDQFSYKYIRGGFTFSSQNETRCFKMPSLEEIERKNYKFWKHM
jgi:hypothetical protein